MVNYAVIGCGIIGKVHCAAIESDPNSNLIYVCDIDRVKADSFSKIFNSTPLYNYNEILADKNIDAITICLPHSEHSALFQKALLAGKHVLCEKPLSINPEELYQMVKLSNGRKEKVTIAFQHRHSPLIIKLKELLNKKIFGDIVSGQINFSCERTMDYYNSELWRGKWNGEGGGTLINQAIHTIDLSNVFLGKPISVLGRVENRSLPGIEVEDFAVGCINYENNVFVNLNAKNCKGEPWKPYLKINGTLGSFTLNGSDLLEEVSIQSEEVIKELKEIELIMKSEESIQGKKCYGSLHYALFTDFTQAILNNRAPLVSIVEAAWANEIVLGLYNSTAKGISTTFPIKEYKQPRLI